MKHARVDRISVKAFCDLVNSKARVEAVRTERLNERKEKKPHIKVYMKPASVLRIKKMAADHDLTVSELVIKLMNHSIRCGGLST